MKTIALAAVAALLAMPQVAFAEEEASEEAQAQIVEMLHGMGCEMDPDDIEMTDDGGYDLDDVICGAEGQFDIMLDAEFNEVSRRAE